MRDTSAWSSNSVEVNGGEAEAHREGERAVDNREWEAAPWVRISTRADTP